MDLHEEQWDEDSTKTVVGKCERCGETRPTRRVVDPFVNEGIYDGDKSAYEWWCYPCFSRRADDV